MLLQKRDTFGMILPDAGDERPAPLAGSAPAERLKTRFGPVQRLSLQPGPGIFRRHLTVEGGIFTEQCVGNQTALRIMPESNVFIGVQVAGHHEETKSEYADVRVAPVVSGSARRHEQVLHLPQVMLGFVVAGGQHKLS